MNWKAIKEKYPLTHDELKEFDSKSDLEGGVMIHSFFNKKGIKTNHLFIIALRAYEKAKRLKSNYESN